MRLSRKCIAAIAALLTALPGQATDGIAISAHGTDACQLYSEAGDIVRYTIANDQVVGQKVIYAGCGRFATFNKKGTHVAFFQGASCARGSCGSWSISTMTIDGASVTPLVTVTNGSDGRLAWATDDWIYYRSGADLNRIKASNPAQKEKVVTFRSASGGALGENFDTEWWGMDAYGTRISIGVERSHVRYVLPGNGTLSAATIAQGNPDYVGYGCNNIISPSGNLFAWTVDAGHSGLLSRTWDSRKNYDTSTTWEEYNSWAVNAASMTTTCTGYDAAVTVGNGFEGNRWSANSDRWLCLGLGYPPNGRFAACGKNQVLVNRQDRKTIMVSANPRASCKASPDLCDLHSTDPRLYNEAGDFWVTGPENEINADLRTGTIVQRGKPPSAFSTGTVAASSGSSAEVFDLRGTRISTIQLQEGERIRGRAAVKTGMGQRVVVYCRPGVSSR